MALAATKSDIEAKLVALVVEPKTKGMSSIEALYIVAQIVKDTEALVPMVQDKIETESKVRTIGQAIVAGTQARYEPVQAQAAVEELDREYFFFIYKT